MTLSEALGWLGTVAVVGAYFAGSFGLLGVESLPYQALNAVGAVGLGLAAWQKQNHPSVAVNVIWFGIGVVALVRMAF